MERPDYLKKIKMRIGGLPPGAVLIPSDFLDIAPSDAVRKSLSRLEADGTLRRVLRGVYDVPEYSAFLGEAIAPDPHRVAQALARNHGWSIAPSGDAALNMLGLSTQVPSVWDYISDGPSRKYEFDNTTLRFRHRTNKEISGLSEKTAMVIQAIKTLGRENIDADMLARLGAVLTSEDKAVLRTQAQQSTVWIYEIIKKLTKE